MEVFELLNSLENGSVYIDTVKLKPDDLIKEMMRLSTWLNQQTKSDWEVIDSCIELVCNDYIEPIFELFLDDTLCDVLDEVYFRSSANEKKILIYCNRVEAAIQSTLNKTDENRFFYFFQKHGLKHLNLIQGNYGIKTTEIQSDLVKPFKDERTEALFNYIIENWNNTNVSKWGYIWRFLFVEGKGKLTNKTEY